MSSVLIVAVMVGLLLFAFGLFYFVPIRRTWKKEHGERLELPGPEVEPYEEVAVAEDQHQEAHEARV